MQGGNLSWIPLRQEVSSLVTFCFICTLAVTKALLTIYIKNCCLFVNIYFNFVVKSYIL